MFRHACSSLLVLLLVVACHAGAQERAARPAMVVDDIGPNVDMSTAPRAKSTSTAIIYEILSGNERPTAPLAAWLERNRINHQQDGYGRVWSFDPLKPERGWRRTFRAQYEPSGPTVDAEATAGLGLTNYLNYKAASQAVSLKLPAAQATEPVR